MTMNNSNANIDSEKPMATSSLPGSAIVACALACVGILLPLPSFIGLYNVAPGSSIRPMGEAALIFLAGIGTPVVVLPFAICALFTRGPSRRLGLLAIALSAIPLPAYVILFRWIVALHLLELKP